MRRIHQLHLSAPSRPLIGRGQRLLEDAFHTASIPFADSSELVFIRQFHVGTIHPSQSPTSLSRQLEQQLQQLTASSLPGTHPNADTANVVTFPDQLTAYSHFAYRLATGQPLQAWFWQKLLPTWQPHQSPRIATLSLLAQLAEHPLGPLATAIVLQTLSTQAVLTDFLAPLQGDDGHDCLSLYGWQSSFQKAARSHIHPSTQRSLQDLAKSTTLPFLPAMNWPLTEARSQWIIALALIAKTPTLTSTAEISRYTYTTITSHLSIPTPPNAAPTQPQHPANVNSDAKNAATASSEPTIAQPYQPLAEPPNTSHTQTTNNDLFIKNTPTQYGGLGYLLNALEQLNFPLYLPSYSQPNTFTYRLLNYIAQRHQTQQHRYPLTQRPIDNATHLPTDPLFDLAPPDYLSAQKEIVSTPYPCNLTSAGSAYCPYRAWHSALRSHLHRYTGLSLSAVIHRPAHFSLTASHFDITFSLDQVDIRLRRSGLDINPGWLPWFGRVVQFHYHKQPQK